MSSRLKHPTILAFSFALVTMLGGCKEESSSAKTLVVATSADNPPFEFYQEGKMVGFDIELMHAIAKRLKRSIEIVDMNFAELIGALQSKRVALVIAGMSPTVERARAVDFSEPYHISKSALITLGTSSIKGLSDLKAQTIGAQLGSTHEAFAKTWIEKHPGMNLRILNKIPDLLQDLQVGRVNAIVIGATEAQNIIQTHTMFRVIELPELASGNAIALPKGSALTQEINKVLQELRADGTLQKLEQKWLQP